MTGRLEKLVLTLLDTLQVSARPLDGVALSALQAAAVARLNASLPEPYLRVLRLTNGLRAGALKIWPGLKTNELPGLVDVNTAPDRVVSFGMWGGWHFGFDVRAGCWRGGWESGPVTFRDGEALFVAVLERALEHASGARSEGSKSQQPTSARDAPGSATRPGGDRLQPSVKPSSAHLGGPQPLRIVQGRPGTAVTPAEVPSPASVTVECCAIDLLLERAINDPAETAAFMRSLMDARLVVPDFARLTAMRRHVAGGDAVKRPSWLSQAPVWIHAFTSWPRLAEAARGGGQGTDGQWTEVGGREFLSQAADRGENVLLNPGTGCLWPLSGDHVRALVSDRLGVVVPCSLLCEPDALVADGHPAGSAQLGEHLSALFRRRPAVLAAYCARLLSSAPVVLLEIESEEAEDEIVEETLVMARFALPKRGHDLSVVAVPSADALFLRETRQPLRYRCRPSGRVERLWWAPLLRLTGPRATCFFRRGSAGGSGRGGRGR